MVYSSKTEGNGTRWYWLFLIIFRGRKQVVGANDAISVSGIENCGEPQCSILGPLLFLNNI